MNMKKKITTHVDADLLRFTRAKIITTASHKNFTKWLETKMEEYINDDDTYAQVPMPELTK